MSPQFPQSSVAATPILVTQNREDKLRGKAASQQICDISQDLVLLLLGKWLGGMGEDISGPQDELHIVTLLGLHGLHCGLDQAPWTVAAVVAKGTWSRCRRIVATGTGNRSGQLPAAPVDVTLGGVESVQVKVADVPEVACWQISRKNRFTILFFGTESQLFQFI